MSNNDSNAELTHGSNQFNSINPYSEQICGSYPWMSQDEVAQIIQSMSTVQHSWAVTDFSIRKRNMLNLGRLLREGITDYAALITLEMGKPITQALEEIEKCAKLCDFYAEQGERFSASEVIETEFYKSYRAFQPLGIVFAIMPWNFPFWQVMRFAVPNLMLGNAALLKHAPNCTGTSLKIEALFLQAGFPSGLFRSLVIDVAMVPFIIHHPQVLGVTLTGSNQAGKSVAQEAGAALKKVVLELGGSDAYVILDDADLELAAEQCVISRLNNCGQVCIAAKRIIVVKKVKEAFAALVIEKTQHYTMGNPQEPDTSLGPMARSDLRSRLHEQVQQSIAAGARCVAGGTLPQGTGYFYPATILLDVPVDSPAFQEELFGPVICIIVAEDEADALRLANQTQFGLAAAIFTQDLQKGERIAREVLEAGTCAVNTLVASDPRLPFGGIKQSGYGRELSIEGMREFANVKTVIVS
ncbi:MAG: NAD-dependent succinate-semialdehyde dehydrogenase [Legionellales bacterium]